MNGKSKYSTYKTVAFSVLAAIELFLLIRFFVINKGYLGSLPPTTIFHYLMLIAAYTLLAVNTVREKSSLFITGVSLAAGAYLLFFVSGFSNLFTGLGLYAFVNLLAKGCALALFIVLMVLGITQKNEKGLIPVAFVLAICVPVFEMANVFVRIGGVNLRGFFKSWASYLPGLLLFAAILFIYLETKEKYAPVRNYAPAYTQGYAPAYVPQPAAPVTNPVSVQKAAPAAEAQKSVFCPECGNRMPAGSRFCVKCGNKLS